jgi:hypothetical protein
VLVVFEEAILALQQGLKPLLELALKDFRQVAQQLLHLRQPQASLCQLLLAEGQAKGLGA